MSTPSDTPFNAASGTKLESSAGPATLSGKPFGPSASLTILVVEDDVMVRSFIVKALTRSGYRVVCAANGHEAIASVDRDNIDLIITDLFMPQMDGMELVLHLRKQAQTIPIIAISGAFVSGGGGQSDDVLRTARLLGAALTLPKPFTIPELVSAVTQVISAPFRPAPDKNGS